MINQLHVRWMIRRDMAEVFNIEEQCFGNHAWDEDDFSRCLRQRNCIGMVAEHKNKIIGFMVYELNKSSLHVLNFAVQEEYQRKGVGKAMAEKLSGKLSSSRRNRIIVEVREANYAAQKFFKAMGYVAVKVHRGYWDGSDEDAYEMIYRYDQDFTAPVKQVNRLIGQS